MKTEYYRLKCVSVHYNISKVLLSFPLTDIDSTARVQLETTDPIIVQILTVKYKINEAKIKYK